MAVKLTGQNIKDTYQQLIHSPEGGLVYDGTGSLLPLKFDGNDIIVSGALRAHSYIVSESITNITSGSTAFGNSLDDTHTFTGAVTSSGFRFINISGAFNAARDFGIINSEDYVLDIGKGNFSTINGATSHIMRLRHNNVGSVNAGADIWGNLYIKDFGAAYDTGHLIAEGNITASGNISASGTILANKIEAVSLISRVGDANTGLQMGSDTVQIEGNDVVIADFNTSYINFPNGLHITASGNISASGAITTDTLVGHGADTKFEVSGSISAYTGSFDIIEGGTF